MIVAIQKYLQLLKPLKKNRNLMFLKVTDSICVRLLYSFFSYFCLFSQEFNNLKY